MSVPVLSPNLLGAVVGEDSNVVVRTEVRGALIFGSRVGIPISISQVRKRGLREGNRPV